MPVIKANTKIVLCINSLDMGGAEKVVVTVLNFLAKQMPIQLVCLEKSIAYPIDDAIPVYHLSKMTGKENNLLKFLMLPVFAFRLKWFCKRNNVCIVQSHLSRANYVNLLAKIMGGACKTHVVIHGVAGEYEKKGLKGRINLLIIRKLYKKADRIFVNSQGVRNDLASYLGTKKQVEIIANPFNIHAILTDRRENMRPSEFVFAPDFDYIITIGRLIASKRHLDLVTAFKIVVSTIDRCQLLVLGEGEEKDNLRTYINENSLAEKVHLLGRAVNPYKYLYRSQLFVSASESESFSNVIIEAMVCHCPVIATDCPYGPREILAPGSESDKRLTDTLEESLYGILVPVRNPEIMAAAIIKLLTDENIRQKYAEQASLRCRAYDIKKIGKLYQEILIEDAATA